MRRGGTRQRRRGLLVGCNYRGCAGTPRAPPPLRGCIADVRNEWHLLTTRFGYHPADIALLTDEEVGVPLPAASSAGGSCWKGFPTRDNMLAQMSVLVAGARPGDSLFFHFSGHGSQVRDYDDDETDGMDEVLVPVDVATAGPVVDDEVHARLVAALPPDVHLTAVIDACHSATAMDLPYVLGAPWWAAGRRRTSGGGVAVSFGACRDGSASADWHHAAGGAASAGAATTFFVDALTRRVGGGTYRSVLDYMRGGIAAAGMSQVPQLASNVRLDVDTPLIL